MSLTEWKAGPVRGDGGEVSGREAGEDCYHCGLPCGRTVVESGGRFFCCNGCLTVHELPSQPGIRGGEPVGAERWKFLDEPSVRDRLIDFTDGRMSRVTFQVPSIHCVACVWLLENLFQLNEAVGKSRVNFARREVTVDFRSESMRLSELAALMTSLGYEPSLKLSALEKERPDGVTRRQVLKTGVAGFAFGNIMLFSLPVYLGLDSMSGPGLHLLFGVLSLILAFPVLVFSAEDYWKSAWLSIRQRQMTLDVPIAMGLAALYGQSVWEVLSRTGEGYLDSLAGLVFFLLCGRWYQTKTYARMAFDRDYRSFFPLAVTRRTGAGGEESVAVSSLRVGDRLVLRHGDLVPADATLVQGGGLVDYSFVTGESEPLERREGDLLYAGGRQVGGMIETETVKPVSQSYLASLWEHQAFKKEGRSELRRLTDRFSRWFTLVVVAIAVAAALGWSFLGGDPGRGLRSFVAVLIVACPCALALAAPFALGTAQRWMARSQVFLRSADVLERIAYLDTLVFDKTGTLTEPGVRPPVFRGNALSEEEERQLAALVRQSSHPLSRALGRACRLGSRRLEVVHFEELPGRGVKGVVDGDSWVLGSAVCLEEEGLPVSRLDGLVESVVHVGKNGVYRGVFTFPSRLRGDMDGVLEELGRQYDLALLSGDHAAEEEQFRRLFGSSADLRFEQTPVDKLAAIEGLQRRGKRVAMIGDGLNDAGALRQSDVGMAVVQEVGRFSPASDVILAGSNVARIGQILSASRQTMRIVAFCLGVSVFYNAVGVTIAAAGWMSPVICAVVMPLSSVTVVLLASGLTTRAVMRLGFGKGRLGEAGKS